MTLFYTRKGDKGYSHVGKKKVYKLNPFVAALGELDELNSMTGYLKAQKLSKSVKEILHGVQENLFIIQANLAYAMLKEKRRPPDFPESKVSEAEKIVDDCEEELNPPKAFVISGSTPNSAYLDILRAKSRKIERAVLSIASDKKGRYLINPVILPYLNRLSSLFFALARMETKKAGKKEQHPSYK
jgi:cob(I)alamin adenosyltransferase